MKRPKFKRRPDGRGWVAAWGTRFGASWIRDDPPFWRWPRVEPHNSIDAVGVLIGWRYTALALMYLKPVIVVDVRPPADA